MKIFRGLTVSSRFRTGGKYSGMRKIYEREQDWESQTLLIQMVKFLHLVQHLDKWKLVDRQINREPCNIGFHISELYLQRLYSDRSIVGLSITSAPPPPVSSAASLFFLSPHAGGSRAPILLWSPGRTGIGLNYIFLSSGNAKEVKYRHSRLKYAFCY